jgi:hypothetical protein
MPKRSSTKRKRVTSNVVKVDKDSSLRGAAKNPAAVALGRLGGLKGGKARAEKLSDKRRHEIAKRAAHARWSLRPSD